MFGRVNERGFQTHQKPNDLFDSTHTKVPENTQAQEKLHRNLNFTAHKS